MIRKALVFAAVYLALSIGIEIVLIVVLRWRPPQDNYRIAPVILTLPPLLAVLLAGVRGIKPSFLLFVLTVVLTVAVTMAVTRITGKSVGLAEPLISRSIAGFLAAMIGMGLAKVAGNSVGAKLS